MTNSSRRTQAVTVHLEPELKSALERIAKRDSRSISNKLRKLAEDCVRAEQPAAA